VVQQVTLRLALHNLNMFVAGFIGTPDPELLNVKLEDGGENTYINGGCFRVKAPAEKTAKPAGLHREGSHLRHQAEDIFESSWPGSSRERKTHCEAGVDVIEPMGPIVTRLPHVRRHSLIATIDAETKIQEGEDAEFVFDMNKAHLFDKDSRDAAVGKSRV